MKKTLIILALLASTPTMGQNSHAPDTRANRGPSCASMTHVCSFVGTCSAKSCPEPSFWIPASWWTDQGDPELPCYHYDNGPYRDRQIEWCLAKVRGKAQP